MSADPLPAPACPPDRATVRARLGAARVGVIGLGGLGSNAASMLVRAGVRRLVLADFDLVDEGNLDRQLFFREQLGLRKTDALHETLSRIDPGLELEMVSQRITPENIVDVFAEVDVLLEAVDSAEDKALLVAAASDRLPAIPLVWVAGLAGCSSANEIVTRRIGETVWVVGDLESDVRDGLPLLASRVMVAAAHEAHTALRILLGLAGE